MNLERCPRESPQRRVQVSRSKGVTRPRGAILLLGGAIIVGLTSWVSKTPSMVQLLVNPGLTLVFLVLLVLIRRGQTRNADETGKKLDTIVRLTAANDTVQRDATLTDEQRARLQWSSRQSGQVRSKCPRHN